jgi:hypothetical protein
MAVAIATVSLSLFGLAQSPKNPVPQEERPGAKTCSGCHAEITNSYHASAMANASGPAQDGLTTGQFEDKDSRVRYRVYEQDGKVWMSYDREGKDEIHGKRELQYFIGAGRKGRTYLFSDDGFWFEAPINWHSQEKRWNMTPAYTEALEIPMNLPAYPDCLNCHTSGVRAPVPGTDSKFAGEPFQHGGIGCERCHGDGASHAAGKGPILNPAKLPPEKRDSICMECHFEGIVAVRQPGKHLYEFQPGEQLSDYIHYFVLTDIPKAQMPQALSQFEALSQSTCKKQSGDKMWCGSCHDAHHEPSADEKVAYYRAKCLACHGDAFGAKHHPDKPDCTHCHMPALPSKDVAHTESTDHRILRYSNAGPLPQLQVRGKPLTSFPASADSLVTTRDYALAWQTLAQKGLAGASQLAEEYLRQAVKDWPEDAAVQAAMGFVEQRHGQLQDARDYYERALKIDPLSNEAAANLGILEARAGNIRRAVELWNDAFARVPNESAIGMNLAMVFCASGQKDIARKYVDRVLEFNPDYHRGKSLLEHMNQDPPQCKP